MTQARWRSTKRVVKRVAVGYRLFQTLPIIADENFFVDWERTSLKPYVEMLERHARGLMEEVRLSKIKKIGIVPCILRQHDGLTQHFRYVLVINHLCIRMMISSFIPSASSTNIETSEMK